jgi:hypothetical protein
VVWLSEIVGIVVSLVWNNMYIERDAGRQSGGCPSGGVRPTPMGHKNRSFALITSAVILTRWVKRVIP